MTKKTLDSYLRGLTRWLFIMGIPRKEVITNVAEVRSHVLESGENPSDTFGTPREYAQAFVLRGFGTWWIAKCALSAVMLVCEVFIFATTFAYFLASRPLPIASVDRPWLEISAGVILGIGALQMLSKTLIRPSTSFWPGNDDDSVRINPTRRRLIVATITIVIVAMAGIPLGLALAHQFSDSPKLTPSEFSAATGSHGNGGEFTVFVRTVIYSNSPSSELQLQNIKIQPFPQNGSTSYALVQQFSSFKNALVVAQQKNWSIGAPSDLPYSIEFGSYYVITAEERFTQAYVVNLPSPGQLSLQYLQANGGVKTLNIPITISADDQ